MTAVLEDRKCIKELESAQAAVKEITLVNMFHTHMYVCNFLNPLMFAFQHVKRFLLNYLSRSVLHFLDRNMKSIYVCMWLFLIGYSLFRTFDNYKTFVF